MHSYSLRDYPLEHVFAVAAQYGFGAVEVSGLHLDVRSRPEPVRAEVARAVGLAERYGVRVYCVGYEGDFVAADPTRRAAAQEVVAAVIEACGEHGIGLVNGFAGWLQADDPDDWPANGSALARQEHYRWAAQAYRELVPVARRCGVRIGIEVHPNTVHDTVDATARLLALVPEREVTVTADPANAGLIRAADLDPAVLDRIADRLGYLHLKNYVPAGRRADFSVDTADGVIDNYRWVARAVEHGGIGAIALEYCGAGDPHPRLRAAREYVLECLRLHAALTGL